MKDNKHYIVPQILQRDLLLFIHKIQASMQSHSLFIMSSTSEIITISIIKLIYLKIWLYFNYYKYNFVAKK